MEIGKSFLSFSVFIMNWNTKPSCSLDIQRKLITSKQRRRKLEVQNDMSVFLWLQNTHSGKDTTRFIVIQPLGSYFWSTYWVIKDSFYFDCFRISQSNRENVDHSNSSTRSGRKKIREFGISKCSCLRNGEHHKLTAEVDIFYWVMEQHSSNANKNCT